VATASAIPTAWAARYPPGAAVCLPRVRA